MPSLQGNDSEEMQRVKVVRLLLQNFPIEALRVRKVSLPMQRHCLRKLGLHGYRSRMLCLWLGITSFGHWCILHCIVKPTLVGIPPASQLDEIISILENRNRQQDDLLVRASMILNRGQAAYIQMNVSRPPSYSHSMVPGGLLVTS